jgi:rhodanese-related sulfurtransferase
MKKRICLLSLLLLVLASLITFSGCDYITGKALDISDTITSPPRWGWSLIDNTYPTTVIDRNTGQPIKDVTPDEAFGIMGTSSYLGNPVVIDVRTPQEFAEGHIWEAINIDYQSPTFKDDISRLDKNYTYIVYCQTGYSSNLARKIMEDVSLKYVINITGGYAAWVAAVLPVEK